MRLDLSALYPLYSVDPGAVWKGQFALVLTVVAAAAAWLIGLGPRARALRALLRCGVAAIVGIAGLQFAVIIGYIFYPSYLNHVEANVAAVSWLGWEGYPLYPPLDAGDVYGIAYGPILYQVTGFFLWLFTPSIVASKIAGLTAFALSQLLSFVTLRRAGAGPAEALTMTGVQCVVQAGFTDQGYVSGARSDALLFLAGQAAVLAATAPASILTAGALGLLGGICAGFKIHGVLYVVPAFLYCLSRSPDRPTGLRLMSIAGVAGAIGLAAPFSANNVSLYEYYHYFRLIGNRQWLRWLFAQNIVFEAMYLAPLFFVYVFFRPKLPYAYYWFIGTLVSCMTLVAVAAAENGAGPHHLLPFLPAVVWGFVVMRREASVRLSNFRAKGRYEALSLGLVLAVLFGYGPVVITSWTRVLRIFADAPLVKEATAEIDSAFADNPGLTIAVGPGAAAFDTDRLRVIPVFRGSPLPIDSTAWMTSEADGVSGAIVERAIAECRVDLWLLPTSNPFVVISHLDGKNIFSAEVLAGFHATYMKARSGRLFDQWKCARYHANLGTRR